MKTATALASIIAFGVAAAQPHLPPPTQSGPFALKVESSNKTIDGRSLNACHSGAGFESLCLSTKPSEFYFNTTSYDADQVDGYSKTGLVVYNMIAHPLTVSEPLVFSFNAASNVAHPVFTPGHESQRFAFSDDNLLVVVENIDDTQNPPNFHDNKVYNRWYACTSYYSGYTYHTIDWVLGDKEPQNPSCVKVDVRRHDS